MPADSTQALGSFFDITIQADISEAAGDPELIGWGIDVYFDESIIQATGVTFGLDWNDGSASADPTDSAVDLDISGVLAFGGRRGVSDLVTIQFQAIALGVSPLIVSDHHAVDMNEGFLMMDGTWADPTYTAGSVTVPEPGTLVLLAIGGLALARRRS